MIFLHFKNGEAVIEFTIRKETDGNPPTFVQLYTNVAVDAITIVKERLKVLREQDVKQREIMNNVLMNIQKYRVESQMLEKEVLKLKHEKRALLSGLTGL